jgi:hypothetical protein
MSNTKQAAARHHPIAWGKSAKQEARADRPAEVRRSSGTRLQAAVPAEKKPAETEPYADVPCTD